MLIVFISTKKDVIIEKLFMSFALSLMLIEFPCNHISKMFCMKNQKKHFYSLNKSQKVFFASILPRSADTSDPI